MMTGRTIIGIIVGGIIIGLATASLIIDLTGGPLEITETFGTGESTSYQIRGDVGALHNITVTAERFVLELDSFGGLYIPSTEYTETHTVEWMQEAEGRTTIQLQNTGPGDMVVDGVFEVPLDNIQFAYHLVVITAGVVIIGFSLGFSLHKPRGF